MENTPNEETTSQTGEDVVATETSRKEQLVKKLEFDGLTVEEEEELQKLVSESLDTTKRDERLELIGLAGTYLEDAERHFRKVLIVAYEMGNQEEIEEIQVMQKLTTRVLKKALRMHSKLQEVK